MHHDKTLQRRTRASVTSAELLEDIGNNILYLDEQALTRDCIARELARRLPEFNIIERPTAHDLGPSEGPEGLAAAILYVHTDRAALQVNKKDHEQLSIAEQLKILEQLAPNTPRVLMSEHAVPEDILDAFRMHIRGYVPTTLPMKQVAEAIRFVAAGGTFVPPSILTMRAQTAIPLEVAPVQAEPSALMDFSPRQNEVLRMLWNGNSNKVIAYELHMSESTVKVHIRHIMKKLHVSNRTQVVLRTKPSVLDSSPMAKFNGQQRAGAAPETPAIADGRALRDDRNGKPSECAGGIGMLAIANRG